MPSSKDRREDTWKESDLKKALKPDDKKNSRDDGQKSKERSSRKSEDKRERREGDDGIKRRRHLDLGNGEEHLDGRRTQKDHGVERDRDRDRDRERDKDRERERGRRKREENKDKERTKEREIRKEKDSERSKDTRSTLERPKERERSKDGLKERESGNMGRDKDRRRDGDIDSEKQKHKLYSSEKTEGTKERERSKEKHRDRDRSQERLGDQDRSKEQRKEKRENREERKDREFERSRDKEHSRERRKQQEDRDRKYRDKDRDKEVEKERRREREENKEHRKERDRDNLALQNEYADDRRKSERHDKDLDKRSKREESTRQRRHHEKKDDRREQSYDKDRRKEQFEKYDENEKEGKIKRREKELMASLKKEEEFRKEHLKITKSHTLEEADVVDEDVEQNKKAPLQRMPSEGTAEEVHEEEDDGYNYEEDDFEDYDEDFEDDDGDDDDDDGGEDYETSLDVQDNSGLQELLQALSAENEGARASSREEQTDDQRETTKEKRQSRSTTHGRINFVAAKQKQISDKVASRTKKRGQELMRLIDLDVAVFDIFDLPPLNEYELYIKNFGRSDTKQAYVQCNEDNVEKEVQTEEIETITKWTQNPANDAAGFGDDEDDSQEDFSSLTEKANIDSIRLASFLQRATQTCLILLEECVSKQTNTLFKENREMTCSDGFLQLSTKHSYLEGRTVQYVYVSPVQSHFLLIAYAPVSDKNKANSKTPDMVQDKGLVCVWNTNDPFNPEKLLICESTPRCCCLSPSKATLAFAGLEDGSIVAWDLREPLSTHYMNKVCDGDNEVIFRPPTFSTAGVLKKDESHLSPVVSLLPLVMPGDSVRASIASNMMSDDMLGLSFQLASLEENASVYLWVVVELDRTNSAGSESDLGLSPGGKIKLIKSSSIAVQSPFRNFPNRSCLQALILRFLPHDPNHVYVGTDGGYVVHCDRHGGRASPKAHRPVIDTIERITAIDLSPWQLPCMLLGSETGNLWLFNLKNEFPLLSWPSSTSGSAILSVRWSHSRPSVFFVLDSQSNLHVWDLLKSDQGPITVENFKHSRVTCFELSSDYSSSGIGIPGRNAELILVYESGAVEIHRISSVFSKASGDDMDRFASYLEGVV